jgi:hypothetical protein
MSVPVLQILSGVLLLTAGVAAVRALAWRMSALAHFVGIFAMFQAGLGFFFICRGLLNLI